MNLSRKRRQTTVVCFATATAVLVGSLWVVSTRPSLDHTSKERSNTQTSGYVSSDNSVTLIAPDLRKPAPDITGTTLDGAQWSMADHRGQIVVMNVWASWCAPCRAEAPVLKKVSLEMASKGVVFAGLDTRDSDIAGRGFQSNYKIPYPSLIDNSGDLQIRFPMELIPNAIPATVVIDREGRCAGRILGRVSEASLRGLINALLAEPAPAVVAAHPTPSQDDSPL